MSLEGIDELDLYFKKLQTDVSGMLNSIMAEALVEIVTLVNEGKNVFGVPFQPYSPGYQKQRRKKGLRVTPNMQYTSDMIQSLHVAKRGKYTYTIGVLGSDRNGNRNSDKLRRLEQMKNYKILFWSKRLKDIADKHWKKL